MPCSIRTAWLTASGNWPSEVTAPEPMSTANTRRESPAAVRPPATYRVLRRRTTAADRTPTGRRPTRSTRARRRELQHRGRVLRAGPTAHQVGRSATCGDTGLGDRLLEGPRRTPACSSSYRAGRSRRSASSPPRRRSRRRCCRARRRSARCAGPGAPRRGRACRSTGPASTRLDPVPPATTSVFAASAAPARSPPAGKLPSTFTGERAPAARPCGVLRRSSLSASSHGGHGDRSSTSRPTSSTTARSLCRSRFRPLRYR